MSKKRSTDTVISIDEHDLHPEPVKRCQLGMRLPEEAMDKLKAKAKAMGVGPTTLARAILVKWIQAA